MSKDMKLKVSVPKSQLDLLAKDALAKLEKENKLLKAKVAKLEKQKAEAKRREDAIQGATYALCEMAADWRSVLEKHDLLDMYAF